MNQKHYLALDLKNDPDAIKSYKKYHQEEFFRPQITKSIKDAGVVNMEIYLTGNRLL